LKQASRFILSLLLLISLLLVLNYYHHSDLNKKKSDNVEADVKTSEKKEKNHANANVKAQQSTSKQTTIEKKILDAPLINQMSSPRLYNGCEVTSLAMLLNANGIKVTKNELANQIKRVPLTYDNGLHGNPNVGFVGNMENGPGLGVNHGPIYDLAKKYAGNKVKDITNHSFDEIIKNIQAGHPVWVIINTKFQPISNFTEWNTPQGKVRITYSCHSVLITGYDKQHIYVNDPYGTKNKQLDRDQFIKAWEQMGKQAIVMK